MAKGIIAFAYSADMRRMVEFYTKGLGLEPEISDPHWTSFAMGDSRFALHGPVDGGEVDPGAWNLDFEVADIQDTLARFREAGAEVVREIREEPFGHTAVLRDPEGRTFLLVQHRSG